MFCFSGFVLDVFQFSFGEMKFAFILLKLAVILFDAGFAVDELDMCEREVADLSAQLTLPLSIH